MSRRRTLTLTERAELYAEKKDRENNVLQPKGGWSRNMTEHAWLDGYAAAQRDARRAKKN